MAMVVEHPIHSQKQCNALLSTLDVPTNLVSGRKLPGLREQRGVVCAHLHPDDGSTLALVP